jgi:hypothetical protein
MNTDHQRIWSDPEHLPQKIGQFQINLAGMKNIVVTLIIQSKLIEQDLYRRKTFPSGTIHVHNETAASRNHGHQSRGS